MFFTPIPFLPAFLYHYFPRADNHPPSPVRFVLFILEHIDHLFEQLFVPFKVSLQVLDVLVLVVDGPLQTSHGEHELLHLEAQLVQLYLQIVGFARVRVHASPLHLLLVVGKLETLFLKISDPFFELFIFPINMARVVA